MLIEKRDVLSDCKQLFGDKEKNPVVTGIGILTDSDNTNTHAIGELWLYSDPWFKRGTAKTLSMFISNTMPDKQGEALPANAGRASVTSAIP
jgi:hypothetical protein